LFQKILVPVDGSDFSIKAVENAVAIAEKFNSTVDLLAVIEIPTDKNVVVSEVGIVPGLVVDTLNAETEELFAKLKSQYPNVTLNTLIRSGHPAREIVEESQNGYDLIIIGSRGLGEIKGFLMGSVSDRVSHHAKCSVMLIH
jgi:nucleotide-binding universal stress UspA family protein